MMEAAVKFKYITKTHGYLRLQHLASDVSFLGQRPAAGHSTGCGHP